jgi:hypothetical protein
MVFGNAEIGFAQDLLDVRLTRIRWMEDRHFDRCPYALVREGGCGPHFPETIELPRPYLRIAGNSQAGNTMLYPQRKMPLCRVSIVSSADAISSPLRLYIRSPSDSCSITAGRNSRSSPSSELL